MNEVYKHLYNKFKGTKFDSIEQFNTYKDEILYIYKQRLNNEIRTFPNHFFHGDDGTINGFIILSYIFFDIYKCNSLNDIYSFYNSSFLNKYKISGLKEYHGSIDNVINTIFTGITEFDENKFIQNNKFAKASIKGIQPNLLYIQQLIEHVKNDKINISEINTIYLRKKGLAYGVKQYFNNDLKLLIKTAFPNVSYERTRPYKKYKVSHIEKILIDNNISIYDLTWGLLKDKYNIHSSKSIDKIKQEYCEYKNLPYYHINYDKFLSELNKLDYQTQIMVSQKLNYSDQWLYSRIWNNSKFKFQQVVDICETLGLNVNDFLIKVL